MFVVFDLDGTLADADHRNPLIMGPTADRRNNWAEYYALCEQDPPVWPVIETFKALKAAGHRVEIWTGRSCGVIRQTWDWLHKYGVQPDMMLMRPIGDHRPDTVLKGEWLAACGTLRPALVIEDRTRMINFWRSQGIMAFQCAPGNF